MNEPLMIDLFAGAGGCSVGYHRAGFDVVGVDIRPQPRYPYHFILDDVLAVLRRLLDGRRITAFQRVSELSRIESQSLMLADLAAIHASPPCQAYSQMSNCRPGLADEYPELVDEVRDLLIATRKPYVIENVIGSGLAEAPDLMGRTGVLLCGQMFGLKLYRHRVFETSIPIKQPAHPRHDIPASKAGHWEPGTIISVSGNCSPIAVAREAMGIDWMNRDELAEAIPPAYTEYIGAQLIDALKAVA